MQYSGWIPPTGFQWLPAKLWKKWSWESSPHSSGWDEFYLSLFFISIAPERFSRSNPDSRVLSGCSCFCSYQNSPFLAVEALKRSKPEREVHCSTATWLVLTHCFWLFQECKPSTCQQHAPWTTRASHFSQSATDTWYSKIDQRLEQSQRRTGRSWRGRASLLC